MKLFTVGPVEMYPETLQVSGTQLPYFRNDEFSSIMKENEQQLLTLCGCRKGRALFLCGSGGGCCLQLSQTGQGTDTSRRELW